MRIHSWWNGDVGGGGWGRIFMLHVLHHGLKIVIQDAEESQSTIDILAAPLSVCLAEELSEGCEQEQDETANTVLTHCLFR